MDPKRRRPVMMLIILITGTILIMLNLPLIIVILGTILGGALGLLITGSVSIKREKKGKEEKKKQVKEKGRKEKKGLFSGLKSALKRDKDRIAPARKEEEIKKIDDMLAQTIEGEGGEGPSVAAAIAEQIPPEEEMPQELEAQDEKDLLLALSEEDFGEDIFDEIKVGDEDDEFPSSEEEELDKQLLIGGAESVDDILAAHAEELGGEEEELPDLSEEGDLESVSSLDALELDEEALLAEGLDDLDLEEEEEEPEEMYGPPEELEEEEEELEEVEEMEEEVSGDLEMISFASGIEEDEMISELKSQKKKKKQEVDLSLVRELRDVKIDVNELGKDMEEVLDFLNKKKEES